MFFYEDDTLKKAIDAEDGEEVIAVFDDEKEEGMWLDINWGAIIDDYWFLVMNTGVKIAKIFMYTLVCISYNIYSILTCTTILLLPINTRCRVSEDKPFTPFQRVVVQLSEIFCRVHFLQHIQSHITSANLSICKIYVPLISVKQPAYKL